MNDEDDFEEKLHALTGALHRHDPTPEWKADILARARRQSPPRWLMLTWAACWLVAIILHAMTPADSPRVARDSFAASSPGDTETDPLTDHREALLAMLAQNESNFTIGHP